MIITDEKMLRVACVDVLPEEIGALRDALEIELKRSAENGRPGIGLAAPQIGIAKKMAIVRIPSGSGMYQVDLVNLQNIHGYDEAFFDGEGCLSFPDRFERTKRFQEIYVTGNAVEPFNFIATGLPAVCIQHEWDHVNGILLPDRADVNKRKIRYEQT